MTKAALNLDAKALKELGIDFRVTKDELINTIIDEQRDVIEAEQKVLRTAHQELKDSLYSKKQVQENLKAMDLPKYIRGFIKQSEGTLNYRINSSAYIALRPTYGGHQGHQDCSGGSKGVTAEVTFATPQGSRDAGFRGELVVFVPMTPDAAKLKELERLNGELTLLRDQEDQLRVGGKKMKRDLLRAILGSTEQGKGLVAMLDGFRASPKVKALKA